MGDDEYITLLTFNNSVKYFQSYGPLQIMAFQTFQQDFLKSKMGAWNFVSW